MQPRDYESTLCPGYTHTAMSQSTTTEESRAIMAGTVPMGRWAEAGEIANAVTWCQIRPPTSPAIV